jgi:hypothetical protein
MDGAACEVPRVRTTTTILEGSWLVRHGPELVGPLGEIHDATTASGAAALFGFIGVDAEQRKAAGRRVANSSLCRSARQPVRATSRAQPTQTLLQDWAA